MCVKLVCDLMSLYYDSKHEYILEKASKDIVNLLAIISTLFV